MKKLLTPFCIIALSMLLLWQQPQRSAAQVARPNILFVIADDWGYGHAGAYGAKWVKTPAFDRVAREGVLFTHAHTPNAKCAPSRAILLTGRNSWQLEEAANHIPFFPAKFKSWVEALGERGYVTGLTAKGWGPGVAIDASGKPRQMAGIPFNGRKEKPATSGMEGNDYAANFADFLAQAPKDKPWSFWYGATEPHRAYEYGSGVAKGGKKLSDIDRVPAFWPDNETTRNDMLDYAFEVEHFDKHLGRMLEQLEQRDLLENTIVIVTSDHGMPFPRSKGDAYPYSNRVPLAIMWKRGIMSVGRVVDDFVSFADLAPTIIELAQLKWQNTGMHPATGSSLTDILFSTKSGIVNSKRDHQLVGKERHDIGRPNDEGYPIRGLVTKDMLYLLNYEPDRWPMCNPETGYLNCDAGAVKTDILNLRRKREDERYWLLAFGKRPSEELYDLRTDPDGINNLAGKPEFKTVQQKLRTQMESELKAQGDPRMFGRGELFDKYLYSDEKNRDFYNRVMRGEKLRANWINESDIEKAPIK